MKKLVFTAKSESSTLNIYKQLFDYGIEVEVSYGWRSIYKKHCGITELKNNVLLLVNNHIPQRDYLTGMFDDDYMATNNQQVIMKEFDDWFPGYVNLSYKLKGEFKMPRVIKYILYTLLVVVACKVVANIDVIAITLFNFLRNR